jgi:hypothetical protein
MKKVILILSSIAFTIILVCGMYLIFNDKNKHYYSNPTLFYNTQGEIYDKFLISSEGSIVYSINDSNYYSFKTFKDGNTDQLMATYKNIFNPILVCGEITGLQDHNEDEEYKSTSSELLEYVGFNPIRGIYSFKNGYLILVQLQNDKGVYLINIRNNTKIKLFDAYQRLNGAAYSESGNYFIISYDNKLVYVDALTLETVNLADELEGNKLNPYIFDDCAFFVNNSWSEYYQVFKTDLKKMTRNHVQPVYQMDHDIRMPKIRGDFLYFIEVINSEYILKRFNFTNQTIDEITNQGVVYNYEFYKNNKIALVYSDIFTPRCVLLYNEANKSFYNISGSSVNHNLSFNFIKSEFNNSYAYELKSSVTQPKGVILYIHPGGSHSDFSPRWDAILMNLSKNGYIIVAPNFHMAIGYGKTYYNSTINQAFEDILEWKEYILKKYNTLPMYCFSISSGNPLMEKLISQDSEGIMAAVSLFGIPVESSETSFSVPKLYILGENDPYIDFTNRNMILKKKKRLHHSLSLISYKDEGHWFRKKSNLQDAVDKIILHYCLHSK